MVGQKTDFAGRTPKQLANNGHYRKTDDALIFYI